LASAETLAKTTMGSWGIGTRINLERALRVGDELGGHIVSGHVDGVAKLVARRRENESLRLEFEAPADLARFIAPKGSVALDGVSLTVNEVEGSRFGVNIIPHTAEQTTLGALEPGDAVNMEIDMLARYVARQLGKV
jgi:riboflavin synthase